MDPHRYRLTHLLAKGGMAEVYAGVATGEEGFERAVAIKRVLPHLATDERIARMFISEAKLAKHLHHQNIVGVVDVGRSDDGLFIVMELVNGWDLGAIIDAGNEERRRMPAHLAAFTLSQVLGGLAHAYRKTHEGRPLVVAHRDVSPSNILVSTEGEVKLADFGIARVEQALSSGTTEAGSFKGKLAYGSPETLNGAPATFASDLFALGVILYETTTGRHPFGEPESPVGWINAITHESPYWPPDLPPELRQVLERGLAKTPEQRFESADAMLRALAGYLAKCGQAANAHELAAYCKGLALPPPPMEKPPPPELDLPNIGSRTGATPVAAASAHAGWFELDPDWKPTGPVMDASGRIEDSSPRRGPVVANASSRVTAAQPRGRPERPILAPRAEQFAPPVQGAGPAGDDEPLELDGRSVQHLVESKALEAAALERGMSVKTRRGVVGKALGALVIAGIVGTGVFLYARTQPELGGDAPMLEILSEPPGASIVVGGQRLGGTPLYTENTWPKTDIEIRLELKGHKPWTGKFAGGRKAVVRAKLMKR